MDKSNDKQDIQKKFRFSANHIKMLQELADERGTSANEVIVSALTSFYAQSKPSEHILTTFARETKKNVDNIATQVADINFLLNDFALLYYYTMVPIFGSFPNFSVEKTDKGPVLPPVCDKGFEQMNEYAYRMMIDRTNGETLENYMNQIWKNHNKPQANEPNQGA